MHDLKTIQRINAEATRERKLTGIRDLEEDLRATFPSETQGQPVTCRTGATSGSESSMTHMRPMEVTEKMVEQFTKAWHSSDRAGFHAERVRAGLEAVFAEVVRNVNS